MARVTELTNTGSKDIKVKVPGAEFTMLPGSKIKNVDVENLSELEGVTTKMDLTEVGKENSGKQLLRD